MRIWFLIQLRRLTLTPVFFNISQHDTRYICKCEPERLPAASFDGRNTAEMTHSLLDPAFRILHTLLNWAGQWNQTVVNLWSASPSSEAAAAPRGAKYGERGGADRQRAFTEPKYSSCQLCGKRSAACALLIGFRRPEQRASEWNLPYQRKFGERKKREKTVVRCFWAASSCLQRGQWRNKKSCRPTWSIWSTVQTFKKGKWIRTRQDFSTADIILCATRNI